VEAGTLRQTKYLQAGTGFLAQHSKELFFGVGSSADAVRATVRWPSGITQQFEHLPVNHRIEIEEDSPAFGAKAFAPNSSYADASPPPVLETLPLQVGTWLIDPLKAPEFSLPDLAGHMRELKQFRGSFVLLYFWSTAAPVCRNELQRLNQQRLALAASHIEVLAIDVDDAPAVAVARSVAAEDRLSFAVLFAAQDVAGIYNIVYRHLFDRHRDLAIPTSFLLNSEGMIVKVYQGNIDPNQLLSDVKSVPSTVTSRMEMALPFRGDLYQSAFQRNDFTYGVAMFQQGYLEQAAKSFQQVIAAKPNDADAYYNLGTLNLRRNEFEEARRYLEQALKLHPDYPEAWNNLGMIAAQQGRPDQAIQEFQQSLSLRPSYAIALLNLGNVYRRQGEFAKALECLTDALDLEPDDPEANYSLGMLYAQQSQLQRASNYLQTAIGLRPDYPEALNNLGVLFVREQNYSKAEEQFRNGIPLDPSFDQSYLNLARLYAMQNDKEKARKPLRELLRLQPENRAALQALEALQ
jgi:Flp pilus assembly protein TadD/peroxiredoxin